MQASNLLLSHKGASQLHAKTCTTYFSTLYFLTSGDSGPVLEVIARTLFPTSWLEMSRMSQENQATTQRLGSIGRLQEIRRNNPTFAVFSAPILDGK